MQAQTLITDIRRELLEISASFWSDAELLRHINRAELDFVNKTRVLEDSAQLSLVQGQLEYPLPDNWISARLVLHKDVQDDGTYSWHRLGPTNLEKMGQTTQNFLNTTTDNQGHPNRYFIWGRSLWLDKAPTEDYSTNLFLFYKSKPIALTDVTQSINIDDAMSEALIAYTLAKAWKKEGEDDRAAEQQLVYDKYVLEGRRWAKKQQGDRRIGFDIVSGSYTDDSNPFLPIGG